MYKLAIPVTVAFRTFDPEAVLYDLRACHADRIPSARSTPIPVQCTGNPDLHIIAKDGVSADGTQTRAVGLFNFFADFIPNAEITVPGSRKHA